MDIDKIIETSTDVKYLNNLLNTINSDIKMMGEFPEFLEARDKILKRMSEIIIL
jgi:hypothetical protein